MKKQDIITKSKKKVGLSRSNAFRMPLHVASLLWIIQQNYQNKENTLAILLLLFFCFGILLAPWHTLQDFQLLN